VWLRRWLLEERIAGWGLRLLQKRSNWTLFHSFKSVTTLSSLKEHAESDLIAPLFTVLGKPDFRAAVAALPGYDITEMGNLSWRIEECLRRLSSMIIVELQMPCDRCWMCWA
jgi:hypothetical protein